MKHQRMSEAMKEHWADPEWAERQQAALDESRSAARMAGRYPGYKREPKGVEVGHFVQITARVEPDVYSKIRAVSRRTGKPIAELLRTYVEWGLEQEGDNR